MPSVLWRSTPPGPLASISTMAAAPAPPSRPPACRPARNRGRARPPWRVGHWKETVEPDGVQGHNAGDDGEACGALGFSEIESDHEWPDPDLRGHEPHQTPGEGF